MNLQTSDLNTLLAKYIINYYSQFYDRNFHEQNLNKYTKKLIELTNELYLCNKNDFNNCCYKLKSLEELLVVFDEIFRLDGVPRPPWRRS